MNDRVRRFFLVLLSVLILSILLFAVFPDAAISVANRIGRVFRGADSTSGSGPVRTGVSSTRTVEAGLLSEGMTRAGKRYYAVTVGINRSTLRLFSKNDSNEVPFKGFSQLEKWLADRNERLLFAMNAGIYDKAYHPLGLHVENGKVVQKLNLYNNEDREDKNSGGGNFYLSPNGVFQIDNGAASIVESRKLSDKSDWKTVQLATQSGPLLVYDGHIHPAFNPDSSNFNIRNGVGIIDASTVVFIISRDQVSLYDFALIFKDDFHCENALYLDGFISGLYLPEIGPDISNPAPFAGILAVTSKRGN